MRTKKKLLASLDQLIENTKHESDNLWHYWQEDGKRQKKHNDDIAFLRLQMQDLDFYLEDYEKLTRKLREENADLVLANQELNQIAIEQKAKIRDMINPSAAFDESQLTCCDAPVRTGSGVPVDWTGF